jgi:hypothetical protein
MYKGNGSKIYSMQPSRLATAWRQLKVKAQKRPAAPCSGRLGLYVEQGVAQGERRAMAHRKKDRSGGMQKEIQRHPP